MNNIYFVNFENELVVDMTEDIRKLRRNVCISDEEVVLQLIDENDFDDVIFAKSIPELERKLSISLALHQRRSDS